MKKWKLRYGGADYEVSAEEAAKFKTWRSSGEAQRKWVSIELADGRELRILLTPGVALSVCEEPDNGMYVF